VGKISAVDIYHAAISAGFPPDKAVTWTAIALAESGGRTDAHAGGGENSWGLWQINVAPDVRANQWGDLTDPLNNARAAYQISDHGRDMSPWTTTHASHAGTSTDYRTYRAQAEAAAGGAAHGDWAGVSGYGDHGARPAAGSFDQIDAGAPIASVTATPLTRDSDHDGLTDAFEGVAGTDPHQADTDHDGLSDGFEATVSHTDPLSADTDHDGVPDAVEWARGTDAGHLAGVAGVAGAGALQVSVRAGVADADHDGLSDRYEAVLGTDPHQADTDHDGLPDGLEHALGTDPLRPDTDGDGVTDGLEHSAGTDPLHATSGFDTAAGLGADGHGPGALLIDAHDVGGH
jgi:hypothetical protein